MYKGKHKKSEKHVTTKKVKTSEKTCAKTYVNLDKRKRGKKQKKKNKT